MRSDDGGYGGGIISDGKLLSGETVAGKSAGRETQMVALRMCLEPMIGGDRPMNVWLHGPPGTGKTMVAMWVVSGMCSENSPRVGIYVNCWQHRTLYSVLQAVVDEMRILMAEAQDTNVKFDRIGQALRGRPMVVILDEIGRPMPAQREEIIYGLLCLPNTGLICIAQSTQALAMFDERILSRLSPAVVEFPGYSTGEVEEILTDRAHRGLVSDSWSTDVIKPIASAAHGDARMAIQVLRQAAAAAEKAGSEKLDIRFVRPLLQQWQNVRQKARLASLSPTDTMW